MDATAIYDFSRIWERRWIQIKRKVSGSLTVPRSSSHECVDSGKPPCYWKRNSCASAPQLRSAPTSVGGACVGWEAGLAIGSRIW
jgi:hypothetical protein